MTDDDIDVDRTIHNAEDDAGDEDDDILEVLDPTNETYRGFYEAFEVFNGALFKNELPDCLFTMQRSKRSRGYFSGDRFAHRRGAGTVDEIALNPRAFIDRSDREVVSTLVHEMTHLWQHHFGKPGRRGYHNKQWSAKMREIGLIPSHTGEPGGKQTGQTCSHYIEPGGPFDREWDLLAESGFVLDWQDRQALKPVDPKTLKVRYACPGCSIHVWGKPGLSIRCEACQELMR
jgi:SprT-like family